MVEQSVVALDRRAVGGKTSREQDKMYLEQGVAVASI